MLTAGRARAARFGQYALVPGDVDSVGSSGAGDDGPTPGVERRTLRSAWRHLTKEDRIEVGLYIVLPLVVLWVLLLFAPASSWLGFGGQIGIGAFFTVFFLVRMWARLRD